ncbi:unnamed protein product, partial [Anisakis simplex]|uniref:Autophagy-related protein 2 n=1 Tax=Anisakis simplex TaxID=6269 RepID=A0A0M3J6I6_ANISI
MVMRESAIGQPQQQQQDGGSARNRMIESDGWDHSEGGTGAGAGAADSAGSGELTSSSTTPASWALSASPASLQSASSSRSSSPITQQQPKHKPNQRAHSSSSSPRSQHCTDCTARDGIVTNQKHDEVRLMQMDGRNIMLATEQSSSSYGTAIRRETFFKEFSFSPAVTIILDYEGKRVKTEQGTLIGLLIGLSNLQCTRLELKELHNRNGMLGIGRCIQFAVNEWIQDIQSTQLGDVIGSYGPITSLVQI